MWARSMVIPLSRDSALGGRIGSALLRGKPPDQFLTGLDHSDQSFVLTMPQVSGEPVKRRRDYSLDTQLRAEARSEVAGDDLQVLEFAGDMLPSENGCLDRQAKPLHAGTKHLDAQKTFILNHRRLGFEWRKFAERQGSTGRPPSTGSRSTTGCCHRELAGIEALPQRCAQGRVTTSSDRFRRGRSVRHGHACTPSHRGIHPGGGPAW